MTHQDAASVAERVAVQPSRVNRSPPGEGLVDSSVVPRAPGSSILDSVVPAFALRVAGLGAALPARRVTNEDLAQSLETSHAWVLARTGITARRIAGPGESTGTMACEAGRQAIDAARFDKDDVDLVIVATSTPDSACPSTSARVSAEMGMRASGFDVNGACTGFVHAFHVAAALLNDPSLRTALVIGSERYTSIVDPDDRGTAILFGDGAGAAVITKVAAEPGGPGVLSTDLGGDSTGVGVIEVVPGTPFITMDGPALFRRATRALVASANTVLERVGATGADVDLYVPHQANARIISAAAGRLGIDEDRVVFDMGERANTSAASVPLALEAAHRAGRLHPGAQVLISGIGAGLAWSTMFVRWGG